MPRSKKKKHPDKPPPKQSTSEEMMECSSTMSTIMSKERNTMISRAMHSAMSHGINLNPGIPTPGLGDCAFEAVVSNNNQRNCFTVKLPLSITSYRQIWTTDMANRTLHTDWNIHSPQEWLAGWQEMSVPGTYERGIFGDLMLPGIACGAKKIILIFNTSPQSPHDPIYVVDPRKFNVQPDTLIPIILAYNQVHYESLLPTTNADIQLSINLTKEYLENRYRYSKKDFPSLLGLDRKHLSTIKEQNMKRKLANYGIEADENDFVDQKKKNYTKNPPKKELSPQPSESISAESMQRKTNGNEEDIKCKETPSQKLISKQQRPKKQTSQQNKQRKAKNTQEVKSSMEPNNESLCYKLRNKNKVKGWEDRVPILQY